MLDFRAGVIAAAMFNAQGGFESGPAEPGDFFPALKPEQTPEDMLAVIEAWNAQLGGEDLTTGAPSGDDS